MKSLHRKNKKERKKARELKLRLLNHLLAVIASARLSSLLLLSRPRLRDRSKHDVNFIHKGIDQEFDIIRVKLWHRFNSASAERVMNHGWSHQQS